jgi:ATP-dependent RNA helicase DeaD
MSHQDRPFLLNKELDNIDSTRGISEHKKSKMSGDATPLRGNPNLKMIRYKVQVGYKDGLRPGTLVGAIANESGIPGRMIGHIEIFTTFSTVDLPHTVDKETLEKISNAKIRGRFLNIATFTEKPPTRHRGDFAKKSSSKKSKKAAPHRGNHFKKR